MNKILFGGAFDPIHSGHINMAEQASKYLDADVIFVPAVISVWKEKTTPIKHKLNMLNLAIADNKKFSIDEFEVNSSSGSVYSIDTVRYFKNKYPNDRLFYLIGTDHVSSFHKWKDAKLLSEMVEIIFFNRPNLKLDKKNISRFKMKMIPGKTVNVSSTEIRDLKTVKMPISVREYISDNNLYYFEVLSTLMSPKRLKHSISVARLAYDIAVSNKMNNPDKYYIAGLLHDIGKECKKELEIMNEFFPEYLYLDKETYHQFVGAYLASKLFSINDKSILNAIKFHTTANSRMSKLAKVLYCADKIEPNRGFDSKDLIEAMMKDIDQGFITVLKANIEFFENRNIDYKNHLTSKCISHYIK